MGRGSRELGSTKYALVESKTWSNFMKMLRDTDGRYVSVCYVTLHMVGRWSNNGRFRVTFDG